MIQYNFILFFTIKILIFDKFINVNKSSVYVVILVFPETNSSSTNLITYFD